MNQSIYRFKMATRIGISVLTLVCFIGAGWFIGRPKPFGDLFIWLIAISVLALASCATLKIWTYKLEVAAEGIHISSIFRSFSHYYKTHAVVRRGPAPGSLEIDPEERKPFYIPMQALDGDPKGLLNQISAHIAPEFIAPDIEKLLTKDITLNKWWLGLTIIFEIFIITSIVFTRQDWFLNPIAFTSVGAWESYSEIEVFSLDSEGIPWFVKIHWIKDNYTVQKVADSGEQTWVMPRQAANSRELGDPIGVASSPNGQFWVIHSQAIFHRTDQTWDQISFPAGETELEVAADGIVIAGSKLWATAHPPDDYEDSKTVFFSLDLLSNEMREIPMPDSAVQAGLNMHRRLHQVGEDSLLMLMKGEQENRIYLFENDAWQEPGYALEVPPSNDIVDFTMDPAGAIWVLLENRKGENTLTTVGEFDSDTLTWNWYRPKSDCATCKENYNSLEVDTHKRLWLAGYSDMDTKRRFNPMLDIFAIQPDGNFTHSERYTPDNSNWQSSAIRSQLRLAANGRIWGADEILVWIDSTRETLPKPLPEWLVTITRPGWRILALGLACITAFARVIILLKYQKDRVKFGTFNREAIIRRTLGRTKKEDKAK